ncbi:MAG: AI-2E family transporter [Oscillospiraceae bacterium]|nr:AI-2E family transporter [Oscillospiraceae bacterium]
MELNKKTWRNVFLVAAGCIVLYWLLHETDRVSSVWRTVTGVFAPFATGAAIAFILNVPMRAIERLLKKVEKAGLRRGIAILLTLLAVLLVLTGVVYLVIPQVVATVETLISEIPGFINRVAVWGRDWLENNPELLAWLVENTDFDTVNWTSLLQQAFAEIGNRLSSIMDQLSSVVDQAFSAVVAFGNGVFNAVMSLVFALYCLSRKEILARQGRRILYAVFPEKFCDEAVRILRMTNSTFSNFISGQCLEAVILGVMFVIAMSIFGMPYMPLVSVIIMITALVPIVGAFVGCALGAFFILVDDPIMAFWFVIMFLVLQQIEGNLIYPRVVGTSVGLPGMWVLVAVAVGGDMMGVGGMLLMIPLASVLYALAREYTAKQLEAKGIASEKLQDHPPELKSGFKAKREKKKDNSWIKKVKAKRKKG